MVRLSGAQSVAASALVAFCAESSRSASERTVALPSSAGSARWCACPGEAAHAPSPDAISRACIVPDTSSFIPAGAVARGTTCHAP